MPIVAKPALDTLPTDARWKYVDPEDIVRCTALWVDPEAPVTDQHKTTGIRFKSFGVRWSGVVRSGVSFTMAPGGFLLTVPTVIQQFSLKSLSTQQRAAMNKILKLHKAKCIGRVQLAQYWGQLSPEEWGKKRSPLSAYLANATLAIKIRNMSLSDAQAYLDGTAGSGSKWAISKTAMHSQMIQAMALQWAKDTNNSTVLGNLSWTLHRLWHQRPRPRRWN